MREQVIGEYYERGCVFYESSGVGEEEKEGD